MDTVIVAIQANNFGIEHEISLSHLPGFRRFGVAESATHFCQFSNRPNLESIGLQNADTGSDGFYKPFREGGAP
jgi:hypothetical protein